MSQYRDVENKTLDKDLDFSHEGWANIIKSNGGRERLIDKWLAYGITRALQSINLNRWRFDQDAYWAIVEARRAAKDLYSALWRAQR